MLTWPSRALSHATRTLQRGDGRPPRGRPGDDGPSAPGWRPGCRSRCPPCRRSRPPRRRSRCMRWACGGAWATPARRWPPDKDYAPSSFPPRAARTPAHRPGPRARPTTRARTRDRPAAGGLPARTRRGPRPHLHPQHRRGTGPTAPARPRSPGARRPAVNTLPQRSFPWSTGCVSSAKHREPESPWHPYRRRGARGAPAHPSRRRPRPCSTPGPLVCTLEPSRTPRTLPRSYGVIGRTSRFGRSHGR